MSKPIRVMHVMGHMVGGGVEATVMNYYRHIDRKQVQFDFVIDSDSTVVPHEEIESLGGRVFIVPPYKKVPQYFRACEVLFRKQKPDIVHSNINALSVFPLAAAKRAGVTVRIAHSHSTANPSEQKKTLVKNILRPYSRVMPTNLAACSEYAARWLFGDKVVDSDKVQIVKNAIDLNRFTFHSSIRDRKRTELGIDESQLVIGQVGRMCFQKNQMFTLDVFRELLKQRANSVLVFVGNGEQMTAVRSKAHEFGLDSSIKFLGVRDDVNELYQAFDVLLLPSKYEGLPVTGVETQALGLPMVASTEISDETFIIPDLVHALDLSQPLSDWVDALLSAATCSVSTADCQMRMANAGYEIQSSADRLADWYSRITCCKR